MRRAVAVCGLVWLSLACAQAREPENTNQLQKPDARTSAAESGESSPAANVMASPEMKTLQRNLSRSPVGLRAEPLANGITKVDLQGRFLHATVLEHRAAGQQRRVCVDHPSAMADLF
jgi:hypothetical protein